MHEIKELACKLILEARIGKRDVRTRLKNVIINALVNLEFPKPMASGWFKTL